MFFIPCLKWSRRYYVQSTCCGTRYSLAPWIGKRIERGDDVEIRPEDLTQEQAGYGSSFKRCGSCGYETTDLLVIVRLYHRNRKIQRKRYCQTAKNLIQTTKDEQM